MIEDFDRVISHLDATIATLTERRAMICEVRDAMCPSEGGTETSTPRSPRLRSGDEKRGHSRTTRPGEANGNANIAAPKPKFPKSRARARLGKDPVARAQVKSDEHANAAAFDPVAILRQVGTELKTAELVERAARVGVSVNAARYVLKQAKKRGEIVLLGATLNARYGLPGAKTAAVTPPKSGPRAVPNTSTTTDPSPAAFLGVHTPSWTGEHYECNRCGRKASKLDGQKLPIFEGACRQRVA